MHGKAAGHALIAAGQWIPADQIADPARSLVMGLPLDLEFKTKGQAAQLKNRTDTQAPAPARPGPAPPPDPGMIPLTVPEVRRLTAATTARPPPPGHAEHWSGWMRIHQARSRWFHQRARLERDQEITMNALVI